MLELVKQRTTKLGNHANPQGSYVLYWMQASQRTIHNLALDFALSQAQQFKIPLVVYFSIIPNYPSANERHYSFMLHNLVHIKNKLEPKGIKFIIELSEPINRVVQLSKDAKSLVLDRGYLAHQREWYERLYLESYCPIVQVEDNVLIPVETVSQKEEYTAATLRGKYLRNISDFIIMEEIEEYERFTEQLWREEVIPLKDDFFDKGVDITNVDKIISELKIDHSVKYTEGMLRSGEDEAIKLFDEFMNKKLSQYDSKRNDYKRSNTSRMSAYLHFGQISPIFIIGKLLKMYRNSGDVTDEISKEYRLCDTLKIIKDKSVEAFLEELLVRRELAINFVTYNKQYNNFDCLQNWAKSTLLKHEKDKRPYLYTLAQLEKAQTHDKIWNIAQRSMVETGFMHGYLRMYWGKRVIEWVKDPTKAYDFLVYLNDKYQLDGRDPNGYAGVAWCFGKHDRPWKEREVFGIVRWMKPIESEK